LITAALAADAGREVFAIPGSIHSPQSRGCHALIRQGAKLVETAQDVLDELEGDLFRGAAAAASAPAAADDAHADPVLEALGYEPSDLDALLSRTGLPAGTLSARLLELELVGRVARLPGGLYQRRATA
jgi:DNA processing protein